MGFDSRRRPQKSGAAIYPRRAGVRLAPDELVVLPRLGGVFHGRPVGPARRRQNPPPYRSCHHRADPHTRAHAGRHRGNGRLGSPGLGKDKIFVLGHSWGSFLGLQLAERRPEWLDAYMGVGQLIDGPESERRGWRFAKDTARRAGKAEAVRELEAIAPYA